VQLSNTILDGDMIGSELYARYDMATKFGPFQPTFGASVTDTGDVWIGTGALLEWGFGKRDAAFLELSLMPGFYFRGSGPDLGGVLEARSGIALGYEFENGGKLAVSFDHRSNADIYTRNPGLETLGVRYSFQF